VAAARLVSRYLPRGSAEGGGCARIGQTGSAGVGVPSFADHSGNGAAGPLGCIEHVGELREVKQAAAVALGSITHLEDERLS
jgi:hypothetical protein